MSQIVFYEAQGKLHIGTVMEQKDSHFQVKAQGSSLQKIKARDVLLQATLSEQPAQLLVLVETLVAQVDLDFLWECAPESVFDFVDIAREYFGAQASVLEQAAMWQAIQGAPIYFGKKGKGQFVRQPFEQIQLALAAVAKKEERLRQQVVWVAQMVAGEAPSEVAQAVDAILQKKNANDMTYKAAVQAAADLKLSLPELMLHIGVFRNAFELHRASFLSEYYPNGLVPKSDLPEPVWNVWEALLAEAVVSDEVLEDCPVFSIDDSMTTEIDDAFSVRVLDAQHVRIGVHIAAPALAVVRDDAADSYAVGRMSTLYSPGEKITMLPDAWVSAFSLDAGTIKPVLSIYTTFDVLGTGEAAFTEIVTKIERVRVTDNLRHDTPELQLRVEDLEEGASVVFPCAEQLKLLWKAAQQLSAIRDGVRGKPENNNRADFNFQVDVSELDESNLKVRGLRLTGEERVHISQRMRGSPIDKIVSEWMIFANVNWASWLRDLRIPALFRTQSAMGVRTTTYAQPHLAMGVPAYMWATSPLRRYADWLNQMQLIAAVRYGVTAPMKAPFQPKEVDLLSRVSQFDERYKAYAAHQSKMEQYWCLRWVSQNMVDGVFETEAIVIRERTLRLSQIPLYVQAVLSEDTPRQTRVRVQLQDIDWVALSVGVRVLSIMGLDDGALASEEMVEELLQDELVQDELLQDELVDSELLEALPTQAARDNEVQVEDGNGAVDARLPAPEASSESV